MKRNTQLLSLLLMGNISTALVAHQQLIITGTDQSGRPARVTVNIEDMEPPAPPAQPGAPIWGNVDPSTLGTCLPEAHDAYLVDGGDGYRYRTWHPQETTIQGSLLRQLVSMITVGLIAPTTTCQFAHEHGEDPDTQQDEQIRVGLLAFGQINRKVTLLSPHPEEPHAGFKVVVFNVGDSGPDGTNRMAATYMFHTGTGGPARAFVQHHSAVIRLYHPELDYRVETQLMLDTGTLGDGACDPRTAAPAKDIPRLDWNEINPECVDNLDMYEIWNGMFQDVRNAVGEVVYRTFLTPAVRDPITVINPANPTEIVYAWDPRVVALLKFPNPQDHFRGCEREHYNGAGYAYNSYGVPTYYTDALGYAASPSDPAALSQSIPVADFIGLPVNSNGSGAYKDDQHMCAPGLGLRN